MYTLSTHEKTQITNTHKHNTGLTPKPSIPTTLKRTRARHKENSCTTPHLGGLVPSIHKSQSMLVKEVHGRHLLSKEFSENFGRGDPRSVPYPARATDRLGSFVT